MIGEYDPANGGGIPVEYWPQRDLQRDFFNIRRLDDMWQVPEKMAVPWGWKLPKGVIIGLASLNPLKRNNVMAVTKLFGQSELFCEQCYEENIATWLTRDENAQYVDEVVIDRAEFAAGKIRAIAALKALAAFDDDSKASHALGLDIDMVVRNQRSLMPVGKPKNLVEFKNILSQLSDNFAKIYCSAALIDLRSRRLVSFDAVSIFFKFDFFIPDQVIQAVGVGGIGKTTAGIDLSDFNMMPFLDRDVPVIVNRMDNFSPEQHLRQHEREVRLAASDVPVALREYLQGAPKALIQSVIYNGIAHPEIFPIAV